jgi:hypothetical protein
VRCNYRYPQWNKTWFEREIDMQIPFSFRAASRAALQAGKLIPRLSFQVKSPSFFSLRHASIGNETKSPYEWHCRFTIFAVLLATCAVVLCAVQGIFGTHSGRQSHSPQQDSFRSKDLPTQLLYRRSIRPRVRKQHRLDSTKTPEFPLYTPNGRRQ